jgi:hypothetical protein
MLWVSQFLSAIKETVFIHHAFCSCWMSHIWSCWFRIITSLTRAVINILNKRILSKFARLIGCLKWPLRLYTSSVFVRWIKIMNLNYFALMLLWIFTVIRAYKVIIKSSRCL